MHEGIGSTDINLKPVPAPPPSYLTIDDESANSGNFRRLSIQAPLVGNDGGSSHAYEISIETVPIALGGTGATMPQEAINNLLAFLEAEKGSFLYFDGNNWVVLVPDKEGQSLSIVNGIPAWTNASVPIPSTAAVITADNETATIPNSIQLTPGDGITVQKGSVAVDNTVMRTNAVAALTTALNALQSQCVMLGGDQEINGTKHFNDLRLDGAIIIAGNKVYNLPDNADDLVGEQAVQNLANKTLVDPIIESSCTITLKTPSGNYVIQTVMPIAGRVYSFYDANCDGDIAIKSGNAVAGGIAYGDGGAIKFSAQGSIGQPFISQGTNAPTCDILAEVGGGTGQHMYNPGDILYADVNGKLQRLSIGSPGQSLKVNKDQTGYIWE